MKIARPLPGVLHLQFTTQADLCRSFLRMQEFYESPYPEIRGKYFTLAEYKKLYTRDHGKPFSYYTDWHGFNIPGKALREFGRVFKGKLTTPEQLILSLKDVRYLIGTHDDCAEALDHELAHARYNIDLRYRERVDELVFLFGTSGLKEYEALKHWLLDLGYTSEVIIDEVNAYMATNTLADFQENFSELTANALYRLTGPFRKLYK